jgi:uncharacterized protein (DUF1697 family)
MAQAQTTFVALLRGINVGKAKAVAMADLRGIAESLGHRDVRTLLRSGNVIFSGDGTPDAIAKRFQKAIDERLHIDVSVVVRTAAELGAVVDVDPIPEALDDGSRLHVMFLAAPLSTEERLKLEAVDFGADVVRPVGREIYVWYRNGMSGSDTAARLGKLVRATATDRNWNTVRKLVALARA